MTRVAVLILKENISIKHATVTKQAQQRLLDRGNRTNLLFAALSSLIKKSGTKELKIKIIVYFTNDFHF